MKLRPRVLVTDQKLSDAYDILTLLEASVLGTSEGVVWALGLQSVRFQGFWVLGLRGR